jgi:hypothetical protein
MRTFHKLSFRQMGTAGEALRQSFCISLIFHPSFSGFASGIVFPSWLVAIYRYLPRKLLRAPAKRAWDQPERCSSSKRSDSGS